MADLDLMESRIEDLRDEVRQLRGVGTALLAIARLLCRSNIVPDDSIRNDIEIQISALEGILEPGP